MTTLTLTAPRRPAPPSPRRVRRRLPSWLVCSVLLHALLLAILLLTPARTPPDATEPTAYDLVFQNATPNQSSGPRPVPGETAPAAPTPLPLAPPDEAVTPPAPPPSAAPLPVPPIPPAPPLPVPPTAPQALAPAVSAPPPPAPDVTQGPAPDALPPTSPEAALPVPPPVPLPRPVAPPRPAPPAPAPTRVRPSPPRPAPDSALRFPAPIDLNYGPAAPRTPPRTASRGIDLSPGPVRTGSAAHSDPYAEIRAEHASADWIASIHAYWLRHRFYPPQAAEAGEDGTVNIRLTVEPGGHVTSIDMESRSGSRWIDMAALATFRDAHLPALPPDSPGTTVELTLHYILIR